MVMKLPEIHGKEFGNLEMFCHTNGILSNSMCFLIHPADASTGYEAVHGPGHCLELTKPKESLILNLTLILAPRANIFLSH